MRTPALAFVLLATTSAAHGGSLPLPHPTWTRLQPPGGLDPAVLQHALGAARCAAARGALDGARRPDVLTVIDYSRPSTERRMWVIDLDDGRVLHHERVAHGQGTGELYATTFGDDEGSHRSSLGLFRTAEVYIGRHGRSMRLDGLEPGFNGAARDRAIVVHGADYADEAFIARHGRLGRSWGCPAVDDAVAQQVIDTIADGSLLFAWYPDPTWLSSSTYLSCSA